VNLHSFGLVASLLNTLPNWPPYATVFTDTLHHREILPKTQNNNLLKTKGILKMKNKLSETQRFLLFILPTGGDLLFFPLVSYSTGYNILYLHTVSCPYTTATRKELVA